MLKNHQLQINLTPNKKIYFASDFHLGAPNHAESLVRERAIVRWLEAIRHDAQTICLVGDIFDFWFEYRKVVPRGFVRLMGKLAELTDAGVQILAFPGNHDMWMTDYFETELSVKTYREPVQLQTQNHRFYITHGDGLGPGDFTYKALRQLFESPLARWAFGNLLHPNWALAAGQAWASYSWQKHQKEGEPAFLGENKEWLLQYAKEVEAQSHHDFYVFGHRHILIDWPINQHSRTIILGDWVLLNSYAVYDGENMQLYTQ